MPRHHFTIMMLLRVCLAIALLASTATAQPADLFEFFEEEAQTLRVITASRSLHDVQSAPATVHVVTREDLDAYGVIHLWDALRGIPGVDVVTARAADGIVSIRGLTKVNNNRILILLNGRRILDGYIETLKWESLPVPLDEIDRIEIVEGPVSALYGGNAISGVINIITLQPGDIDNLRFSLTGGTGETGRAAASYGHTVGGLSAMASAEFSTSNQYELPSKSASEVVRGRTQMRYDLGAGRVVSLTAGGSDLRTEIGEGGLGNTYEDGKRGFLRADYQNGRQRLRASWARGSTKLESFGTGPASRLTYGSVEVQALSAVTLSGTELVFGGEVRHDDLKAALGNGTHDVWALFLEHHFSLRPGWSLWTSARLDNHPHAGKVFSPRVTAVVEVDEGNTVRLTGGTAFRHPTLLENHLDLAFPLDVHRLDATGQIDTVEVVVRGSTDLSPERLRFGELSHAGWYGRLHTRAAFFVYRLLDVYMAPPPMVTSLRDGVVRFELGSVNGGTSRAWGGELLLKAEVTSLLSATFSYSHQKLSGMLDDQVTESGTPNDKASVKLHYRRGAWIADAALHRVGSVSWNTNRLIDIIPPYKSVDGYMLLDASLRYRFHAPLERLEVQLVALNALSQQHHQVLPSLNLLAAGQGGEEIGSRYAVRLVRRY
jgi:outer membrane receptor protein involved in Fe transport